MSSIQPIKQFFGANVLSRALLMTLWWMTLGWCATGAHASVATTADLANLTHEEKTWLAAHPILRLAPDPEFQPIEFFDEQGQYAGIGADYVALIGKKLGIQFDIVRCANWDDVIDRVKRREVDVLSNAVKTPQRESYLLFPSPYLTIPSVIIARKNVTDELTLEQLTGLHVVMVSGYGYADLVRNTYPQIELEFVADLKAALRKVSFGMADAFVGDLATASFYIEAEGITNLKLAGETEPPNISGFAVRADWPELSGILEKGIALVTESERREIYSKWIHLGSAPGFTTEEFKQIMWVIIAAIAVIVCGFLFWTSMLNRMVRNRTKALLNEVDERKLAEQELEKFAQRLAVHLEQTPLGVIEWDLELKVVQWNRAATTIFGYTREEALGHRATELIIPDSARAHVDVVWQDLVAREGGIKSTNHNVTKSGKILICEWYNTLLSDSSGALIGVASLVVDITHRVEIEREIEEQKLFIKSAIDAQQDTFFVFEPTTGKALLWNKACETISGYSSAEIANLHALTSYYSSSDIDKVTAYIERVIQGASGIIQLELITKDGRHIPTEYSTSVLRDQQGQPKAIIAVGRDISERQKAETEKVNLAAQLRQAQKMEAIGTLAGGIAHDFNNILAAILGYAEIASTEVPESSSVKKHINEVLKAGLRAKQLVHHILSYSRKSEHVRVPVQVSAIVDEALRLIRASIPSTIRIEQDIDVDCGAVLADPVQIHQVIMNLCTNAAQAMEEQGGVLAIGLHGIELTDEELSSMPVSALKPGRYLKITVRDTGPGIEQHLIERIFDPYFTTKDVGKGSGMGLAVVHGIVTACDGLVKVESTSISANDTTSAGITNTGTTKTGTTFSVLLPKVADEAKIEVTELAPLPEGQEHILVVDDEQDVAEITKLRLEQLGYRVTTATDSRVALELVRTQPGEFALLITDQTMPNMTGEQLVTELKLLRLALPTILCTGYSAKINAEKARKLGINAFIMKPVGTEELAHTIRQVLSQKA